MSLNIFLTRPTAEQKKKCSTAKKTASQSARVLVFMSDSESDYELVIIEEVITVDPESNSEDEEDEKSNSEYEEVTIVEYLETSRLPSKKSVKYESEWETVEIEQVLFDDPSSESESDNVATEDEQLINGLIEQWDQPPKKGRPPKKSNSNSKPLSDDDESEYEEVIVETIEEIIPPEDTDSEPENGCSTCYFFGIYCQFHGTPIPPEQEVYRKDPEPIVEDVKPKFYVSNDLSHRETMREFRFKQDLMIETFITYSRRKNGEIFEKRKRKKLPLPADVKERFARGEYKASRRQNKRKSDARKRKNAEAATQKNPKSAVDIEVLRALTAADIDKIREESHKRGRGRPKKGQEVQGIRASKIKKTLLPEYEEKRGRPQSKLITDFSDPVKKRLFKIIPHLNALEMRLFKLIIKGI